MAESKQHFANFEEFWPYYLRQHSKRETRLMHFAGLFLAFASLVKFVTTLKIGWLISAPIIGYGFSWAGHLLIEQNAPLAFEHPKWSLLADIQMIKLWVTGELNKELERHGIPT